MSTIMISGPICLILIGNTVVRFTAQEVQELISVWNKQLADLTTAFVKFKV